MKRNHLDKVAVALLALTPTLGVADWRDTFIDPNDGMLDASKYLSEHTLGFLPVPVVITEPAVGAGLGLMGLFFHESEAQKQAVDAAGPEAPPTLPTDISMLGGAATDNGTRFVGGGHLGFWKHDHIRYRGFVGYASVNLDFFSLGGVELPRPVELNIEGPAVFNELKFRVGDGKWLVGGRQFYRHVDTGLASGEDPMNLPADLAFTEFNYDHEVTTSGAGLVAEYDSTDNQFNPERGHNHTFDYLWYDDAIGSDVDFRSYNATSLNYFTLKEKYLLGLRLQYDGVRAANTARLPAYVPPAIQLRGVSANRYQGNDVLVAEAALDYRFTPRWKAGVFLGIGRAAQHFGDLNDAPSAVSKGVGFRYLIARRYGFVMGLDVARGPEETAYYIQAGSTW